MGKDSGFLWSQHKSFALIKIDSIIQHYENCWHSKGTSQQWKSGPSSQLTKQFCILTFSPSDRRDMWIYATCGMSIQGDATPIELHLFSPVQTDKHVELLTSVAHYHIIGDYLDVGHTVNFGRPWIQGSICEYGLISLPYLDGPRLEWLELASERIRFLWLVPITREEMIFAKQNGLEALESRFESRQFNYLDPLRQSVA